MAPTTSGQGNQVTVDIIIRLFNDMAVKSAINGIVSSNSKLSNSIKKLTVAEQNLQNIEKKSVETKKKQSNANKQLVTEEKKLDNTLNKTKKSTDAANEATKRISVSYDKLGKATASYIVTSTKLKDNEDKIRSIVTKKLVTTEKEITLVGKLSGLRGHASAQLKKQLSIQEKERKSILDKIQAKTKEEDRIKSLSKTNKLSIDETRTLISIGEKEQKKTKLSAYYYDVKTQSIKKMSLAQKLASGMWDSAFPKLTKMNNALNTVRWSMVNLTFAFAGLAALVSPFYLLIKAGMDWELQLRRIQIVSDGVYDSTEKVAELSSFLKDARIGTPFGRDDTATAFLEFSKAGFGAEESIKALPDIMDLAIAGFTDLDTATKIVAQSLHAFSVQGLTSTKAVDVIAKAANESASDVETFGSALAYVGPIAANLGFTFEETAAALALLSNAGLRGSKAGTALRQVFNSISNPSEEAKKAMARLGISFYDTEGNIKSLNNVMNNLSYAMVGLSEQGKAEVLGDLFSIRSRVAASAFLNIINDSKSSIEDMATSLDKDIGYAADKSADAFDTSIMKMKDSIENLKDSFEPLGTAFARFVAPIIDALSSATGAVAKATDKLGPGGNAALAVGGTALAAVGATKAYQYMKTRGTTPANPMYVLDVGGKSAGKVINEVANKGGWLYVIKEAIKKGFSSVTNAPGSAIQTKIGSAGAGFSGGTAQTVALLGIWDQIGMTLKTTGLSFKDLLTTQQDINEYDYNNAPKWEELDAMRKLLYNIPASIQTANVPSGTSIEDVYAVSKSTGRERYEAQIVAGRQAMPPSAAGAPWDVSSPYERNVGNPFEKTYRQSQMETLSSTHSEKLNVINGLNKSFIDNLDTLMSDVAMSLESTEVKSMITLREDVEALLDPLKNLEAQGENIADNLSLVNNAMSDLTMNIERGQEIGDIIDTQSVLMDKAKDSIDKYKNSIDSMTDTLNNYKTKLSDVNDEISLLSKPTFAGQSSMQKLMTDYDRFLKEQDLASIGITNVQDFLAKAVKLSNVELQELLKTFQDINEETASGTDSYTAWKETVNEFISDTIKSGNDLGTNVSGAVKKYKTLLLSTSKFSDENSKSESGISVLKDAYDVYYGGMTDDVNSAIQAHADEESTVYATSEAVISALEKQWKEQDKYESKVESTTGKLDKLHNELDGATDIYDKYKNGIEKLKEELTKLEIEANKVILSMDKLNTNDSSSSGVVGNYMSKKEVDAAQTSGTDYYFTGTTSSGAKTKTTRFADNAGDAMASVMSSYPNSKYSITSEASYLKYKKGGIINSPTVALMGENEPEMVIPMSKFSDRNYDMQFDELLGNDGNSGKTISIENINISGVNSDDPGDFAYQFAQELKRELKNI